MELKTFKSGESVTVGILIAAGYDLAQVTEAKVYIGGTVYAHSLTDRLYRCALTSKQTSQFTGSKQVTLWLKDTASGVRKHELGELVFIGSNASASSDAINTGYDVVVPLNITEETIEVGAVMYNFIKGVDGLTAYQIWLAAGNEGTQDDYLAWQKQPAIDAASVLNEIVEVANIAIDNANQATTDANQATIEAQAAATLANQKATLANQAAIDANAAKELAMEVAEHPDVVVDDYWHKWNTVTHAYENTGIRAKGYNGSDASVTKTNVETALNIAADTTPVATDEIVTLRNGNWLKTTFSNLVTYLKTLLQEKLVSGTNIKTVNGSSLLGSGNIETQGILLADYQHTGNKEVIVESIDFATGIITATAHGLVNANLIFCCNNMNSNSLFPVATFPNGIVAGTQYWVINKTDNTFQLSLTSGGAAISITDKATKNYSKWHFEILSASLNITGLPDIGKGRIEFAGKTFQTLTPAAYIIFKKNSSVLLGSTDTVWFSNSLRYSNVTNARTLTNIVALGDIFSYSTLDFDLLQKRAQFIVNSKRMYGLTDTTNQVVSDINSIWVHTTSGEVVADEITIGGVPNGFKIKIYKLS